MWNGPISNMNNDISESIQELNQALTELYYQYKFPEALILARKAVSLARKYFGEDHPDVATSLNNLATIYYSMGSYAKAEPLYRQLLEIKRKALGEGHPDFANSLNMLAFLYYLRGNYAKAEPLYRQAMEILREAVGEDHLDFAKILNNIALLHYSKGDYAKAEPLYWQATDIRRKVLGEDHPDFADNLNKLANLYHLTGKYAEAESLYQKTMEILRNALGEHNPNFATSISNLAAVYCTKGEYSKAEVLTRQAIEIKRKVLGEDHPSFAISLQQLAVICHWTSNYAKAELLYRQAMETIRKALGEDHPDYASIQNSLAALYRIEGRHDEAELLYWQAIETFRKTLGKDHPDFATSIHHLADLYHYMGKYEKAEPLYLKAMQVLHDALGEGHFLYANILINFAGFYHSLGGYDHAVTLLRQAMEIQQKASMINHPHFVVSLNNLSMTITALGQIPEAFSLAKQANQVQDKLISQVFSFASEGQRMAYLTEMRKNAHCFFSLVWKYLSNSQEAIQSAMNLALRRKAIVAESLSARRDGILGGRYPHLRFKLDELNVMRMQIAQKILSDPGKGGTEERQILLDEWNTKKERLESELAREIPEMNLEERLREAGCRPAAASLKDISGTLVEFVRFDVYDFNAVIARGQKQWKPARYLAFLLHADKSDEVQMVDLGEAEHIDRLTAGFRAAIANRVATKESSDKFPFTVTSAGVELRKAIFDPLKESLGDHKRIIISPDGDLSRIPFEALPDGRNGFLIDDYQFSYVAVGRDLLRFGRKPFAEPMPSLVAADPDFNLGTKPQKMKEKSINLPFERLLATRREGEAVAKKLGVSPWLDRSVLEKRLKGVRSPKILHIATHGFFHEDQKLDPNEKTPFSRSEYRGAGEMGWLPVSNLQNPLLLSGLALAGANTSHIGQKPPEDAEDGLLTAEDVTGMDLLDTELVVLSACDTGLGEIHIGEGVMGLRRSFLLAGAKTLVMSLWKVPNNETRELMEEFYNRLLDGAARAEALRQAQLALKAKYPNPYFWGAFICQGDPSPIEAFKQPM